MKDIYLSVDPGFDSYKVVVNGHKFLIPYSIEEINLDSVRSLIQENSEDYIRHSKTTDGRETNHIVGEYARFFIKSKKSISNNSEMGFNMKEQYDAARFITPKFIIGMESVVGYALYNLSKLEKNYNINDEANIHLMIEYPHSLLESYGRPSAKSLLGDHTYELYIGNQKHSFSYKLNQGNVNIISQVISAINSELMDDEGRYNSTKSIETDLPVLVLDGGYGTFGIINVREKFFILAEECESNQEYAMMTINEAVASEVNNIIKNGKAVSHFEIAHKLKNEDYNIKYLKDNVASTINIKELYDKGLKKKVEQMISYLDSKYNNLLDEKLVLIAGGTGSAYYDLLKNAYVDQKKIFDQEHFRLCKKEFMGNVAEPVFAVAIGGYKALKALN